MISEIRKFKVGNEIKEGMVHGKFKDNSFIVTVKNFKIGEMDKTVFEEINSERVFYPNS
jgi:hypothetical protein